LPRTKISNHEDLEEGLIFLGLQAMIDPPRPEAIEAVRTSQQAGIQVKMITGDHVKTATAFAGKLGIIQNGSSKPAHCRITGAELKEAGHTVAMTGDGVSDAPALRKADIGIAMGKTGTDVTRETADMVLIDNNFASIEAAVEEGRGVYDNLIKFITWTLPTNLTEGGVILLAAAGGYDLPGSLFWVPE
jgi:cation-transporting P-type ATPase F